jgi:hypothetical protein
VVRTSPGTGVGSTRRSALRRGVRGQPSDPPAFGDILRLQRRGRREIGDDVEAMAIRHPPRRQQPTNAFRISLGEFSSRTARTHQLDGVGV